MSDTDKYEGLIDAEGYIDYDGIIILLSEVKQLRAENKVLEEALEQVCLELAELRGEEE